MDNLLQALENKSTKKKPNNALKFILFMEMEHSEKPVPFYIVYWFYRKWCLQNTVRTKDIVTKHILSRSLSTHFKNKYTYPKSKRFGIRINYEMVVYVKSPYMHLSKEEEETAFNYYHIYYDTERSSWKNRKRRRAKDPKQNTQD